MQIGRLLITCALAFAVTGCSQSAFNRDQEPMWKVGFFDDFDTFNPDNWQDQILWVNNEDQCYVRDNLYNTRSFSVPLLTSRVLN